MDNSLRLQYLEAMGIDVWLPRASAHCEQPLSSEVITDNAEPETIASTDNWDELQAEVASCTKCALCATRTQTVFGSGNKQADWMLVGEAPGQHEDEQGLPFVGNAGLLLTEMLRAIGLTREEVFITNILKCRPPNNRDPHSNEVESCNAYLQRQLKLIQPKIILAIGRIAAQTLLKTDKPLARLRGKVHTFNNTPVVVVYHPAYLLRSLSEKRKAWLDLQLAIQTVKNSEG
ncbi:MAG: uracil-DNA glycosylase [Gammaproteobacteria bacterium]